MDTLAKAFGDTVATKTAIAEVKTDMLKIAVAVAIIMANATLSFTLLRGLLK